jgi:hypothetical protein
MVDYVGKKINEQINFLGARSILLCDTNMVYIALDNLSADELYAFDRGDILCSLLYQNGVMMLVWKFLDKDKSPEVILPSYFRDHDSFPVYIDKVNPEQPLEIGIQLIDIVSKTIKVTRQIKMEKNFSNALLIALSKVMKFKSPDLLQLTAWSKVSPPLLYLQGEEFKQLENSEVN